MDQAHAQKIMEREERMLQGVLSSKQKPQRSVGWMRLLAAGMGEESKSKGRGGKQIEGRRACTHS